MKSKCLIIFFIYTLLMNETRKAFCGALEAPRNIVEDVAQLRVEFNHMKHQIRSMEKLLSRSHLARTCHELMNGDPTLDEGLYYVDPDGFNTGDPPVQVHCSKSGETSVLHDTMEKTSVGHCFDPGCYTRTVGYNASLRQMRALIELSPTCKQFIRYDCLSAVLAFEGIQYGWWNDRNGVERYYWTGSNDTVHTCACGITGECVDPNVKCDCDASAPLILFDEGYITNQKQLPITRLNFGRTSPSYSVGEHTLGSLLCSGSYQTQNGNKKPTSCADLWRAGNIVSGIYLVQPIQNNTILTVFCDMTKLPEEDGHQTVIGTSDVKSQLIFFSATRSSLLQTNNTITVTFEMAHVNMGNALNLNTGIFTCPVKGIYSFSFNCRAKERTLLRMYHNEALVGNAYTENTDNETIGNEVVLSLDVADIVYVEMRYGFIFDDAGHYTSFTGTLLQEL